MKKGQPFWEVSPRELNEALKKAHACEPARRWVKSRANTAKTLMDAIDSLKRYKAWREGGCTGLLTDLDSKRAHWAAWFVQEYYLRVSRLPYFDIPDLYSMDLKPLKRVTRHPARALRLYVDAVNRSVK